MRKKLNEIKKIAASYLYLQYISSKDCIPNLFRKNNNKSNTIFLATVFGLAKSTIEFEKLLGSALYINHGSKILVGMCGGYLKTCMWDSEEYINLETKGWVDNLKRKMRCLKCSSSVNINSIEMGASIISFKNAAKLLNLENKSIDDNKLIMIKHHADVSAVRKCLVDTPTSSDLTLKVSNKFYTEGIKYYLFIKNFLLTNKIDRVVMAHGIYMEHGILLDVCKELSIKVYVYGFGYRQNTVSIVFGDTYHKSLYYLKEEQWNVKVTERQRLELKGYIYSKISGGRDMVNYHPNPLTDIDSIKLKLNLDNRRTVLFCTNVLWDASIYYASEIYNDLLSALFDLIEIAITENTNLIVRIHPAESKGGLATKKPIMDEIRIRFGKLPTFIIIISPDSDISTYALGDIADLIIIYGSNIGLEFAINGKRVVNIGKPFAYNKGFTIDVKTRDELIQYVSRPELVSKMSVSELERAENFGYFWYFKFMTLLPELNYDVYTVSDFSAIPIKEYDNQSKNLRLIAESINKGSDFDYQKFE